jgi:hemerythrin-like domain-containing protein
MLRRRVTQNAPLLGDSGDDTNGAGGPSLKTNVIRNIESRRLAMRDIASGLGLAALGCTGFGSAPKSAPERSEETREAEVTPGEDLMQEHGVLERVLLIYDEAARRLESDEDFDLAVVSKGANIVRSFVEEYHERLEEDFVFPKLEAARREVELVAVLREQHRRGRELTAEISAMSRKASRSADLGERLRAFARMYRPHAAREDTVLFPAYRSVLGRRAYQELGEEFEEREHARFGANGFEEVVSDVARLEAELGIAELGIFTPR